ncbi:MAG: ATP-binding cassette domain-containing protein [Magnetococcales bacterium]|nr:ATP-binding cassette domain-containing protein [Magnetococcales bacterium]
MALIGTRSVKVTFGGPAVLDEVGFFMDRGERVCLVGRNGSGKSTLMRLLAGRLQPDEGEVVRTKGITVASLEQEVPGNPAGTVFEVATREMGRLGQVLLAYRQATHLGVERLGVAQEAMDAAHAWETHTRLENLFALLGLNPDLEFAALSGGLKRRTLLACALAQQADVLLLDEPTNHLDVASIEQLEGILKGYRGGLLFITHDRMFLGHLATRILEMDRGRLTDWPGDFATYQQRKDAALESEATSNALFDKRLAQEETWIRQGIKARRTRNEGRVRALERMRLERQARREREGRVNMRAEVAERSGKLVMVAEEVSCAYDGIFYVRNFSTVIQRGDKVGIIGPNGCGKTTLLNLLLGNLAPQSGTLSLGTNLEVAYFDQLRAGLEEEKTVADNVANGRVHVTFGGQTRHIISYLQDFLFAPERARSPVRVLSGGERNRLLLAKLFLLPSNILVMDEPTNDLDAETLELLEELLVQYAGTLLLVSHDRAFLNNVVTSTLVFEGGEGRVREYAGGYDDWLAQRPPPPVVEGSAGRKTAPRPPPPPRKPVTRLSFRERQELDLLPARIDSLENEQRQLHAVLADPSYYRQDPDRIARDQSRLAALEQELASAYQRWELLEKHNA